MARELMRAHYEPGNQSRSIKYVWRRYALPEMGVCYNTFLRLVRGSETRQNVKFWLCCVTNGVGKQQFVGLTRMNINEKINEIINV